MTRGRSGGRGGEGGGWRRLLMTRGRSGGRGGWGLELEATADDQRQRCVLWGEDRQWELESARREGEGEGAPQQQSNVCQNERRTRSVGLEAFSHVCSCEKTTFAA